MRIDENFTLDPSDTEREGEGNLVDPPINPERLELAMQLAGVRSITSLAAMIGRHKDTVRNWTKERATPHRANLHDLARILAVPVSFLTDPSTLHAVRSPNFRTSSKSVRALHERYMAYSLLVGTLARFLVGTQDRGLAVPGASPAAAAARVRERAGLGERDPVFNTLTLAAAEGIAVAFAPKTEGKDSIQIDAFSAWAGSTPVIVLSPEKGDFFRQRFDVAHEMGHLAMHHEESALSLSERERQAHEFASRLLFPRSKDNVRLLARAIESDDLAELKSVSNKWGISVDALLRAAIGMFQGRQAAAREKHSSWQDGPGELQERPSEANNALADLVDDLAESRLDHTPYTLIALESGVPEPFVRRILARRTSEVMPWPDGVP